MDRLPLFPLGTVLLPGARLPLRIFEPRYVQLLRDLTHAPPERRTFGVVAIRRGHEVGDGRVSDLYSVGCEARLVSGTTEATPAGPHFHIETVGARRFALGGTDAGRAPYVVGEVDWLAEAGDPGPPQALLGALAAYRAALGGSAPDLDAADPGLAYRVAGAMLLDVIDLQRVLEAPDAAARHRLVLGLLRRETELAGRLHLLPAVGRRFGEPSLS